MIHQTSLLQSAMSRSHRSSIHKLQFVCHNGFWCCQDRPIYTGVPTLYHHIYQIFTVYCRVRSSNECDTYKRVWLALYLPSCICTTLLTEPLVLQASLSIVHLRMRWPERLQLKGHNKMKSIHFKIRLHIWLWEACPWRTAHRSGSRWFIFLTSLNPLQMIIHPAVTKHFISSTLGLIINWSMICRSWDCRRPQKRQFGFQSWVMPPS